MNQSDYLAIWSKDVLIKILYLLTCRIPRKTRIISKMVECELTELKKTIIPIAESIAGWMEQHMGLEKMILSNEQ